MKTSTIQRYLASTAVIALSLAAQPAFAQNANGAADTADAASTAGQPAAAAVPAAGQSTAATTEAAPSDAAAGDIIVKGQRFIDLDIRGATKLPLPLDKIPQSVSLVSRNLLDGLNIKTAGQLAQYVPGLYDQGSFYGFRSEIKSRGFALDDDYGYKVDGFQFARFFEFDDAMLDRVEVVRGPSSATYGIAAPGGLVNYVLKAAPSHTQGQVSLSYGSFDEIRGQASLGGPLNASGSLRALLVTSASSSGSFVDHVNSKDVTVGAIVDWDATDRLSLKAVAYLTRQNSVPYDGVPIYPDGTLTNTPRSLFLGSASKNRSVSRGDFLFGEAKYRLSDHFELGGSFSYQKTYLDFTAFYPLFLDNNGVTSIRANQQIMPQHQTSGEIYALAKFSIFGVEGSSFRLSGSYYNSIYSQAIYTGSRNPIPGGPKNAPVSIFDTDANIQAAIQGIELGYLFTTPYQNKAQLVSAQTVLKPAERLSLVGGITLNHPTVLSGDTTYKFNAQLSYRAGVSYEIIDNLNLYGSWSDSFFPQQNKDINRKLLPPLRGEQWEAGAKAKLFNGRLLATLAAFTIKQTNAAVSIPGTSPEAFRAYGEVRHRGVELELVGNINRNWNIYGGASYLNAMVTKSDDPTEVNRRRPFIPAWTGSLFTTYTVTDGALTGLRLGAGGRVVGSMPTSTANTKYLPGYAVFDALVSYTTGPWELRVNANNILDKTYRLPTYDSLEDGLQYGTPRSVLATIVRKF